MKTVFKYKPLHIKDGNLSDTTLSQAIEPVVKSYFYLPNRTQLNDPCEGVYINKVEQGISGFINGLAAIGEANDLKRSFYELLKQIEVSKNNSGIFSLSQTPIDELMWAYYGNSHCGIVIEYNLELLTRFTYKANLTELNINYDKSLNVLDINNLSQNPSAAINQMLGKKSDKWAHESEFRIIIENMHGQIPHDYRAVESITFGINVPDKIKQEIYEDTKSKVKYFYQLQLVLNSYNFERVEIKDFLGSHPSGELRNVDWGNFLDNVDIDKKQKIIHEILSVIQPDPHFLELTHADVSTLDQSKIAVNYQVQHDFELGPWAQFSKYKLDYI
jgi:hypothetical protein